MRRWARLSCVLGIAAALLACGAPAERPPRAEDFLRVGVEVEPEAASVEASLLAAGYARAARWSGEGYVALGFVHEDGRRAVRVITSRGVAAALDSHEADGVRPRHGQVTLHEVEPDDVDGDGRPEVVVAREEEGRTCLEVLRIAEDGRATLAPSDAEALAPGGCVEALEDIDGDGAREGMVVLAWPELAMEGAIPSVRAPLQPIEGAWRARGVPASYLSAEREARLRGVELARQTLDVASAVRLAIELAALSHLDGAAVAAQVRAFDALLAGLVLDPAELEAVRRARGLIAAGWRTEDARDTPAPNPDGRQESEEPG